VGALVVEAVGPLATVQDLGRPGHAALGVTTSGAADRSSLRLANRLVGNDEGAAGIEALLGRVTLRAEGHVRVAVSGAPAPVTAAGHPAPLCAPLDLRDGERLTVGSPASGLRTYVAVAGGVTARRLFGSASTDPTSGLGPPRLEVGQRLELGADPLVVPDGVDLAAPASPAVGALVLRVVLGPRDDWFTPQAVRLFLGTTWRVTDE
jgi:allophanate hydrolase subunit 2